MTTSSLYLLAPILLISAVAGVSCSSKGPEQATQSAAPAQAAPAPAAAPAQTAPPANTVIAPTANSLGSAQYSGDPDLRCDLLEVKRASGNALLVRWKVANGSAKPVYYDFKWDDLYYIDPAENKKYAYLTDSEGKRILDAKWGSINPGEQWLGWAKFPAPPAGSAKVSVNIAGFAPFEDVPVAQ